MTMNVKAKLTLDSAQFDTAMKNSGEVATATARAQEKAAKEAAQAQAFAAKYASDTVSDQSLRIVVAKKLEAAAAGQLRQAHKLAQSGYLEEAEAAKVEAAALQRLTAAKLEAARASQVEHSKGGLVSLREHIEGLSIGGTVGESILGIGEALAVAEIANKLREAVASALEFGEAMQRASEKTGLEVTTLSTLHYAAATTGGDFEAMAAAVAKMDKAIGAATEGNKKEEAFLKSLGLNAKELADSPDGAEIAFRKFAQTLAATENPIRRVELATGLLGKTGAEQIPTIIELGNNWDEFRRKAEAAGVLMNARTAGELAETQKKLKELKQDLEGAGIAFTTGFTPALTQMLNVISGGKTPMEALNELGQVAGKTFAFAAAAAYGLASAIEAANGAEQALVPGLGNQARESFRRAEEFAAQAAQFRDIVQGRGAAAPPAPGLGDDVADFLDRNHLGGRYKRRPGSDEGFEGIGDLTNSQGKVDEAKFKAMQLELNEEKLSFPQMSARAELDFWNSRIDAFQKGSDKYDEIVAKQAELIIRIMKEAHEKIIKFQAEQRRQPGEDNGDVIVARAQQFFQREAIKERGVNDQDIIDTNRLSIQQAQNSAREMEAKLNDEAGRSMTRYAAAIELAKVHAKEFAEEMQALEAIRNTRALTAGLDPSKENNRALAEAQAAIAEAQSHRQIQIQADNDKINGRDTSALVGATDALNDFIQATRDFATEMRNLTTNALNGLNSEIVKGISGQRTSFAQFGGRLGEDVAGAALRKGEASLLSIFGLGSGRKKPTGSPGDPLHVISDNPAAGVPAALSGLIPGSDAKSGGGGALGFLGSLAMDMLPGFADGGVIAPNTWAMVGERGPEPFFSGPTGGTVIPNHAMNAMTDGGDVHNWTIDARGATDPAAVHAQIMAAAPHIAAAAVHAVREGRLRSPSTRMS